MRVPCLAIRNISSYGLLFIHSATYLLSLVVPGRAYAAHGAVLIVLHSAATADA